MVLVVPFRRTNQIFQDGLVSKLQDSIAESFDPLNKNPLLNGNHITNINLSVGDNSINHLLNRSYIGYIICSLNAVSDIYVSTNNVNKDKFIILNSSANCIINLYVF